MSSEYQPPDDLSLSDQSPAPTDGPPVAEFATAEFANAADENETTPAAQVTPELALPPQFQNLHANGGAVAAVFLGVLCIFGAFITQWSLFNAALGIALGLWGMKSRKTKTSLIGIGLCGIGAALCILL
jgi:hypothetical protein